MTTYGELLDPLVAAALKGDVAAREPLLQATAKAMRQEHPSVYPDTDEAMAALLGNLRYYAGYCEPATRNKVYDFFKL